MRRPASQESLSGVGEIVAMKRVQVVLAATLMVMAVACRNTSTEPIGGEGTAAAYLMGRVIDTESAPVEGVVLSATAYEDGCRSKTVMIISALDTTDTTGSFASPVGVVHPGSFVGCIVVLLTPPVGSGLGADSAEVRDVPFRGSLPWDTVEATFVLSPMQ